MVSIGEIKKNPANAEHEGGEMCAFVFTDCFDVLMRLEFGLT